FRSRRFFNDLIHATPPPAWLECPKLSTSRVVCPYKGNGPNRAPTTRITGHGTHGLGYAQSVYPRNPWPNPCMPCPVIRRARLCWTQGQKPCTPSCSLLYS